MIAFVVSANVLVAFLVATASNARVSSFQLKTPAQGRLKHDTRRPLFKPSTILYSSSENQQKDDVRGVDTAPDDTTSKEQEETGSAATNTINERLMAELEQAKGQETGGKSSVGKKLGFDAFRSSKTEEEREAAIAEARDLNGVNPGVALAGSAFALVAAAGLWSLTNFLAEYFVLNPVQSDTLIVERATAVIRNVIIGITTLASGFFGVTGLGIFLLGIRVAYGVFTGELDPTPIKKSKQDEIDMPDVWSLMMNKKPGRRR